MTFYESYKRKTESISETPNKNTKEVINISEILKPVDKALDHLKPSKRVPDIFKILFLSGGNFLSSLISKPLDQYLISRFLPNSPELSAIISKMITSGFATPFLKSIKNPYMNYMALGTTQAWVDPVVSKLWNFITANLKINKPQEVSQ